MALCMQHTILEFNNCASFSDTVAFHCGDERACEKDKDVIKSVIAIQRTYAYDSACGAGCLFNFARMWTMRGKIPRMRPAGPSSH